jgi:uncharacterized OsmC-like protein
VATNARGGELEFGTGEGGVFTPVELLLTAIAGCSAIDVDMVTSRRAEPESLDVTASADKVRTDGENHLENIEVTFSVSFPAGEAGDAAREVLPRILRQSNDRLCTVSRTVQRGTEVTSRLA